MDKKINDIVIVGGGTAGWLTACILAKQLNCLTNANLTITLIESPDIPTIGVGEGTVPTMRQTLQLIGVSETDFIRRCDVTFKQSIKFVDWLQTPQNGVHHQYHHLFNLPHAPGFDLTPYWLLNENNKENYATSVSMQEAACQNNLAPKKITQKEFQCSLEYAYHLDALKFSAFLGEHGTTKLGIKHVKATIEEVVLSSAGDITELITNMGDVIKGDFFVDCSGFSARLIAKALAVSFVDKGHQLLVDTAIAIQVPYSDDEQEIPPYTISTAQEAGWIWDIGLSKRRGTGYVYSSKHTSDEKAEKVLRAYIGDEAKGLKARKIPMRIGYREKFWHKNCVALGLAAGFVEPLEATALLLVEATAKLLAEKLPNSTKGLAYAEKSFNKITQYAWDRVIDFIKLHYFLSKRTDTSFWLENTQRETVPQSLLDKLDHWRENVPCQSDFFSKYEVFQLENYQYVLYGMEFNTDLTNIKQRFAHKKQAEKEVENMKKHLPQFLSQLSSHRTLITKIKQYGLSKI